MREASRLYLLSVILISAVAPVVAQKTVIISIQKTSCFGTCPVFTMDIYSNCKVILKAEQFVNLGEGTFKSKLTRTQMNELKKKFEDSDFFEFNESYSSNVSDLPTTFLYYNSGTNNMKIKMYGDRPQPLQDLDHLLMTIMKELNWKQKKNSM